MQQNDSLYRAGASCRIMAIRKPLVAGLVTQIVEHIMCGTQVRYELSACYSYLQPAKVLARGIKTTPCGVERTDT
jgi:hypothetical protein